MASEVPEVEMFEVDLMKDTHGLGITIAGYVGGDNTPGNQSEGFKHTCVPANKSVCTCPP